MRVPIVAVAVAVLVAACAGDGDSGVEPNATAATMAPTPATPQAATSTPASLTALPESEVVYDFYPEPEQPWHKIPSIAVLAATDDRRVGMLTESVAFWNEQLEQIGSPFRLGAISHSVEGVSPDAIARLSARFSDRRPSTRSFAGGGKTSSWSCPTLSCLFPSRLPDGRPTACAR